MDVKTFERLSKTYFVVSPTDEPYKHYVVGKGTIGFQREIDFARKDGLEFEGHRLMPHDYSIIYPLINDPLCTDDLDILYLQNGQVERRPMLDFRSSY